MEKEFSKIIFTLRENQELNFGKEIKNRVGRTLIWPQENDLGISAEVEALKGLLSIERGKVQKLSRELAEAESQIGVAKRQISSLSADNYALRAEITRLRATSGGGLDVNDPQGYLAALGLRRSDFEGLTEVQKQALIKNSFSARAKVFHPDAGGDTTRMQKLNAAFEVFKDPSLRRGYIGS